jgi:type IV pilus assembly protein PilC
MIELARFSRTTAMLLHAGINLTDVMDMACNSTRNIVVGQAIKTVRSDLIRGRTLAVAMGTHKVFTAALVQMVAVGEETGRLESTLATIAQAYETEADEKTTALISFIEPAMTLVIALVVGFIALSVVMPMYTIIGTMG